MIAILRRALSELPLTAACLFFSGLLFMGVSLYEFQHGVRHDAALTAWGAIDRFSLWDGEWWRILVTVFHHGNFLHLIMNSLAVWYMGGLLEPRLGPVRYGAFLCGTILVSALVSAFVENSVGLSGVGYGMFGLLLSWRRTNADLRERFSDAMVQFGLIWLFACVPLTVLNILPIGNGAHFSGFIYGWLAGEVWLGPYRSRGLQSAFLLLHLAILPGFYFVTHPIWNGTYHWRMADVAVDDATRIRHWRAAVRANPRLAGPWYNMAQVSRREGDVLEAWRIILRGISYNPAYQDGIQLARVIWQEIPDEKQRQQGRDILKDIFKQDAEAWQNSLIGTPPIALEPGDEPVAPRPLIPIPADFFQAPNPHSGKLPPPDPNAPHSAEEGRAV